MTDLLPLRALVWRKPEGMAPVRLRDPVGDALTLALRDADLWRSGISMDLEVMEPRVSARLRLPEREQGSRGLDQEVAHRIRAVIAESLRQAGFGAIFTDALWSEAEGRGWTVVARARRVQSARQEAEA